jgi:hypothetical protein
VNLPFTTEQFLNVFVAYNAAIWPAQIAMYILGLIAIAALRFRQQLANPLILFILALMWAWNAIGYHFLFFTAINLAANVFAGIFMLQALLCARCAIATQGASFQVRRDFRSVFGIAFIIYAMAIYPILGIKAGHGLMLGPMLGVAPCPTTIFTIGMLMLARGRWVVWLSVIPLLWSIVGLAAALQLGLPEDLGLPVAGFLLLITLAVNGSVRRDPKAQLHPRMGHRRHDYGLSSPDFCAIDPHRLVSFCSAPEHRRVLGSGARDGYRSCRN